MITFSEELLGTMIIKQSEREYKIEIRRGNCLAVFVHEREDEYHLYNFYVDESHIKRIIKSNDRLLFDDVVSCRLNLRYKESLTLAKYIVKDGVEVVCYYA